MKGKWLAIALAAVLLASCTRSVQLQYPDGRIVECGQRGARARSRISPMPSVRPSASTITEHRAPCACKRSVFSTALAGARARPFLLPKQL
jgi:hypothetical protein